MPEITVPQQRLIDALSILTDIKQSGGLREQAEQKFSGAMGELEGALRGFQESAGAAPTSVTIDELKSLIDQAGEHSAANLEQLRALRQSLEPDKKPAGFYPGA